MKTLVSAKEAKLLRSLNQQDNHEMHENFQDLWYPLPTAVDVCESSSLRVMSRAGIIGTNQSLLALTSVNREILVSFHRLLHMQATCF